MNLIQATTIALGLAVSSSRVSAQSDISATHSWRPELSFGVGAVPHERVTDVAPTGATASLGISAPPRAALGLRVTLNYVFIPEPATAPGVYASATNLGYGTLDFVWRPGWIQTGKAAAIVGGGVYREWTGLYTAKPTTVGLDAGARYDPVSHVAFEATMHVLAKRLAGMKWVVPVQLRFAY